MKIRLLFLVVFAIYARPAAGFSLISDPVLNPPPYFANLDLFPSDYLSWNTNVITYKFDANFNSWFSDPRIKDQVRLAFGEWSNVSGVPAGTNYSYLRATATKDFGDIRSIAVHEIGHALGLQHPNQANVFGENYFLFPPALLVPTADAGTEAMHSTLARGACNHIVGQDEYAAFGYIYGARNIVFTEITNGTAAITLTTYDAGNKGNWGRMLPLGGILVNSANPRLGAYQTNCLIQFNTGAKYPIGFQSLGINWDYQNLSGDAVHAFEVCTHGTDNPPLYRWDNGRDSTATGHFDAFASAVVSTNAKDDLLFTWSNPQGGDIPVANIVHVGIELDVWDWTPVYANVVNSNNVRTAAPVLGFHKWGGVHGSPAGFAMLPSTASDKEALDMVSSNLTTTSGVEFRCPLNGTTVSNFFIGDATRLNLGLADLTRPTLNTLLSNGTASYVSAFTPRTLNSNETFIVVLAGGTNDLPATVLTNQDYLVLNRPDLVGRELFTGAFSSANGVQIGTYALLSDNLAGSPYPMALSASITNILATNKVVLGFLTQSNRAYLVEYKTNLADAAWTTLNTVIGGGNYQTLIDNSPAASQRFYRARTF